MEDRSSEMKEQKTGGNGWRGLGEELKSFVSRRKGNSS